MNYLQPCCLYGLLEIILASPRTFHIIQEVTYSIPMITLLSMSEQIIHRSIINRFMLRPVLTAHYIHNWDE